MNPKAKIKIMIDILMTIGLLFVSGYQFWGEAAHEWVGTGMFMLFIAHHFLNVSWYRNMFKGKYTPVRIFQLLINLALLAVMVMQMYSGIVLSRHVLSFLPIESGLALGRRLHILGAYWGFLLMSLHLGLYWNMILGMIKKCAKINRTSRLCSGICFIAAILTSGYGAFVFMKRDFPTYMLLKSEFVFMDYSEPVLFFYLDYLALMGLCIFTAHYILKLCQRGYDRKGANK